MYYLAPSRGPHVSQVLLLQCESLRHLFALHDAADVVVFMDLRIVHRPTPQVIDDITTFINSVPVDKDITLFLMGQSMGGAEVLGYADTGPSKAVSRVQSSLVESPFIALSPNARP